MSSKKKLIISLSVAAAVLVAAIIAIVAVFAAAQQSVASSVKVTFRAKNVDCAVKAEYQVNGATTPTLIKEGVITATDGEQSFDYSMKSNEEIELFDGEEIYVDFIYTITNTSVRKLNVTLDNISDIETPFGVEYYVGDTYNSVTKVDSLSTATTINAATFTEGEATTTPAKVFVVRLSVVDRKLANDASISVTMNWGLDAIYDTEVQG